MTTASALVETLRAFFEPRREVLEAYLFGSAATGSAQRHSDIDVAVYVNDPSPPASALGYPAELTSELMSTLRTNRVDLVILNEAPPLLYHRVLRDGVRVLSRNLAATTTREGQALSRYCDFVPQLAKIEAAHRARTLGGRFGQ